MGVSCSDPDLDCSGAESIRHLWIVPAELLENTLKCLCIPTGQGSNAQRE